MNSTELCSRKTAHSAKDRTTQMLGYFHISRKDEAAVSPMTDTEWARLHVRVIALENLVISLLAEASDKQLDLAREMASYISPRSGFTPHPLTIDAAAQMIHLVERARHFRT